MAKKKDAAPAEEVDDGIRTAEEGEPEAATEAAEEGVSEPATEPADVEPEGGEVGEPEPESDPGPVGVEGAVGTIDETTEVVGPPPIEIPNEGAIVLVTDKNGTVHEAVIVRKVTKGDRALVVCTKDGSDEQIVVTESEAVGTPGTWAAPS
jgi:hypothetical protein